MTDEGVRLARELMSVNAAMRRLVRRRLREQMPPRLRPAQVELLVVVGDHPGISVAAAARELHLADNSVSTLVNQLLAAGMLRRETDPDDRRAVRLELTPDARRHMTDWRDRRARMIGARIEELTEEDRTAIAAALPALGRLLASLREQAGPAKDTPGSAWSREP
ncbi:MarR family winged helix-turn-helix transcriptional regulator [Actinoallomurus acaciae]|uniref:MarR family winged helix-turn-helix transcriptional regulator n=1 Tax=Actinoallomurus acaciae TaxID=502577 RepID=A0ABV5Y730_9ACTN